MAATAAANAENPPIWYVIKADFPITFVVYDLCEFHMLTIAYVGGNS
jgi:hypothetical protein